MNITLKQIKAFVAVADERSFTRASARLHVTQSTLTSSIKALEDEIGMQMFDRSTRAVLLTPRGETFLPIAQRLLRDLSDSLEDLRMTADRERGSVTVAAAASFVNYVCAPAIIQMAQRYQGISIRVIEGTTESVTRMVLSGEADFGVCTLFQPVPDLDSALLLTDTYGAVFHARHALNDAPTPLPWSALASHRMIRLHRTNGIRILLDMEPRIAALYRNTAYEVGAVSSMQPLLAVGFGYATVPALAAKSLVIDGLCFEPLVRPRLRRKLCAVKRKGRSLSPSAVALFEAMAQAMTYITPDATIDMALSEKDARAFCYPTGTGKS